MLIFYLAFILTGLLGMFIFGGNPVICGILMGSSFAGGILTLFVRGKFRVFNVFLISVCVGLCLFMGQAVPEGGMEDYGERIRRAKAQIEQGNIEEAAELLDRLDSKFGITDLSCYARAEISLAQEEYDRAQKWLGKVENRSQGRWYEYMEMVLGCQDTETALTALEQLYLTGAEELPDNGHLQYMAGLVKLSRGNNQEAAYCFRRADDLGEEKGLSCYYMGLIRYELGDGEAALKYFEEALKQGVDQEKEDNILWYMERLGAKE